MLKIFRKREEDNKSVMEIIDKYEGAGDPVTKTLTFVKEFLGPYNGREDMTYRFEHTLRTARWGLKIAEGEGWDPEPLVMACLLHDVGYPKCTDFKDFKVHPSISAEITRKFLEKINYDSEQITKICRAVSIHDRWNDVPADATPFELSVRDADDLDRFGIMRTSLLAGEDITKHTAAELGEICQERLATLEEHKNRLCGTPTAEKFWAESLECRRQFYENLIKHTERTFELQKWMQERA